MGLLDRIARYINKLNKEYKNPIPIDTNLPRNENVVKILNLQKILNDLLTENGYGDSLID